MSTTDSTIPDASTSPLAKLYRKRVAQNRDLTVLISDWNLERGSGKSTLALRAAARCDRTAEGVTPDKCTLSATELSEAYTSQPPGSSLVLDEAEAGVSNRRSMSGINEAMRRVIGMGRVEQKYLFMTTPGVHQVDKDIRAMCDVWIFVRELGEAQMFRVNFDPFLGHELTRDWGTIRWPAGFDDLSGRLQEAYDALTIEKRKRLRGEGSEGEGYVKAEQVEETAEERAEQAERQKRDELLRQIYEYSEDMTQQDVADAVGLSRSRVADIISDSDG